MNLSELILKEKSFIFLKLSMKYLDTSNQLTKKSTKKPLADKISMKLLKSEFKSDIKIKSKPIKYIVRKYCPIMNKLVSFYFI